MAQNLQRPLRVIELVPSASTGSLFGLAVSNALGTIADTVVLSDPAEDLGEGKTTLDLLQVTVAANMIAAPSCTCAKLQWGDAADMAALREIAGGFDVAIGSELLGSDTSVTALEQTVVGLGAAKLILVQHHESPLQEAFGELMKQAGYLAISFDVGAHSAIHVFKRSDLPDAHVTTRV